MLLPSGKGEWARREETFGGKKGKINESEREREKRYEVCWRGEDEEKDIMRMLGR